MTEYFELGRVLKPQGIKGEVKVHAFTDSLDRFDYLEYVYMLRGKEYQCVEVVKARTDARFAYLLLADVTDRDVAEKLRGKTLYIDRAHAAKLPEGHYYISDLVGMEVCKTGTGRIGVLDDILQTGSRDIYMVRLDEGGSLMFPSVDGVILERDVAAARMEVDADKLEEVAVYDI